MAIQYTVLGFKQTTFRTLVASHNHKTGAPSQTLKILIPFKIRKFCLHVDRALTSSTKGEREREKRILFLKFLIKFDPSHFLMKEVRMGETFIKVGQL